MLLLTLDACVETQAKRVYNETVNELLKEPHNKYFQQRLKTIGLFNGKADIPKLRAESEKHLLEGKEVVFIIWQEDGKSRWEINIG